MTLTIGTLYTRREIHSHVGGGDLTSYLPHKDGQVLCGCFDIDFNRYAPSVIDLGTGKDVEHYAKKLSAQGTAIRVFLKRGPMQWQYVGRFRAVRYGAYVSDLRQTPPLRAGTVAVLYLIEEHVGANDEITEDPSVSIELAVEGGRALVQHLARERSRYLAEAKRRAYRAVHGHLACEACKLSESELPANIGEGCFEVHHLKPLANRRGSSLRQR